MMAHAERKHSELGPSQSSRWRKCIPSIALCAELPDPPANAAALEGTFVHEWSEYCLRNGIWNALDHVGDTLEGYSRPLELAHAEHINIYLGLVEKIIAPEDELYVEQRFSLARYFGGTPDGDGTADCVIYKPETRHLHVIDYKNGFIAVDVEGNTQAIQYALGAFTVFQSRGVDKITVWICQPKLGPPKKWSMAVADLYDYGEDLKDDYAKTKLPGQPFVCGAHCRWCKANTYGKCAAIREHSEREAAAGFTAVTRINTMAQEFQPQPTPQELGDMLKRAEPIRVYLKALDELAESEAKAGRVPIGRKWVATPGRRVWNPDLGGDVAIAKAIERIIPGVEVWDEKLKTAPALEKELGKKEFAKLDALVTKTAGGFSLVSEDDRRPAVEYGRAAEGFEAIS